MTPMRLSPGPLSLALLVALTLALLSLGACNGDPHDACAGGTCVCEERATCDFACGAPPCHVACRPGSSCAGACANGTCTCDEGASCDFACDAPPCHVRCSADHPRCNGTCANGTCTCGPRSSCTFTCAAGPCHTECPEGARCVVLCPPETAGTQNCDIVTCAAGDPVICPDGRATTCGAPCPTDGE